ncbi:phasin family protein [Aromatoleum toluclasticum]|uniref:phasin family protein n=1 Tax=Aromatoleum toluclasticum TaxID=92003 RepID=UPI00036B35CD|nr:phasin family protein [Aromatoleum toluclasticum]MCC4113769.1 phasin family protein [Aromatoleum toluclasticum]
MIATTDTFASASRNALAAVETSTRSSFDTFERLVALNINASRSALEDSIATLSALLSVKTPNELVTVSATLVRPATEKTLAWFRSSYEILAQGVEEAAAPYENQYSEVNKAIGVALEKAAKSAPAGSEAAVAAVQSAIAAANSAYDSVNKATRKVIQFTEANVAATARAAVDAVSTPAPAPTKAKKSA